MPDTLAIRDERLKTAVRNFLRQVSHTAQYEIEKVVRQAIANGKLKRAVDLPAAVSLHSEAIGLEVTIHSRIEL